MISLASGSDKFPEAGGNTHPFREKTEERQLALERYRYLKSAQECNLTFDDKLFIENFEAAVSLWWKVKFLASNGFT
jgi:hypothetical protein